MYEFPLTDTPVILGKWWIEERKVTFNKETQILRLYNHDLWYCLQLKPAKKVLLMVTRNVKNSIDKKTEKSFNAIKEDPK